MESKLDDSLKFGIIAVIMTLFLIVSIASVFFGRRGILQCEQPARYSELCKPYHKITCLIEGNRQWFCNLQTK